MLTWVLAGKVLCGLQGLRWALVGTVVVYGVVGPRGDWWGELWYGAILILLGYWQVALTWRVTNPTWVPPGSCNMASY